MAYNHNNDHGLAGYKSWAEVDSSVTIPEGSGVSPATRKFARLVYVVGNSSPSGAVTYISPKNYSSKIITSGNYTFVGKAQVGIGANISADVWQVQRIYDDGSGNVEITWADGNDLFDNVMNDYATLNYTF